MLGDKGPKGRLLLEARLTFMIKQCKYIWLLFRLLQSFYKLTSVIKSLLFSAKPSLKCHRLRSMGNSERFMKINCS